jgi:chromosome segregation ATPase
LRRAGSNANRVFEVDRAVMPATVIEKIFHVFRHEDIRDAILSLVHMFRDNTDKLERHEYRERQLGDQLKKILNSIERKQKNEETSQLAETLNAINRRLESLENTVSKVRRYSRWGWEEEEEVTMKFSSTIKYVLPTLFYSVSGEK